MIDLRHGETVGRGLALAAASPEGEAPAQQVMRGYSISLCEIQAGSIRIVSSKKDIGSNTVAIISR